MKTFCELKCESCGTKVELRVDPEDLPKTQCPHCGQKTLRPVLSTPEAGPCCSVDRRARFT